MRAVRVLRLAAVALSLSALSLPTGQAAAVPSDVAPEVTPAAGAGSAVPDELVVTYRPGADRSQRDRARGRAAAVLADRVVPANGARAEVELVRLKRGSDRSRAARQLRTDPAVAYVEPNLTYRHQAISKDARFVKGELWGMYGRTTSPANTFGSNAAGAWAAGRTGSAKVYVGVIDEGIQHSHPELSGQVRNPGETKNGVDDDKNGRIDDVYGWDFNANNASVYDGGSTGSRDDHGTHVAGTIGAKSNTAGVVGVNWNVQMISGKFLGTDGGTLANAIKAVDYFTDLKARGVNIVATNNSWGGGGYSQALADAIERADRANILFVAAAGNGDEYGRGLNNDLTPNYPSSYPHPNVISVAAITKTGGRASFSNYGKTNVDLGAPGAAIVSTTAYNGYSSYSGTSMAAPHVTGAAALYASVKPGSSAATIKAAILNSAVPTTSLQNITVTGDRLEVNAALAR
nr:S8 family peptidase [uncultured Friedmanniella sp.]